MNLLALDTATESCSVALLTRGEVIDRSELLPRRHAEHVLPMAESLLAEAGLSRSQIDGIAVGRGPGAFTGVRLGVSVAQGLAFALDRPAVTVSSLAALAMEAPAVDAPVLAVIDARMGEVYAGAFRHDGQGTLQAMTEECVCKPDALDVPAVDAWQVVGTGWSAHEADLRDRMTGVVRHADGERYPQARHVLRLSQPAFTAGETLSPEEILPVYLRNNVAQTLRERGKA